MGLGQLEAEVQNAPGVFFQVGEFDDAGDGLAGGVNLVIDGGGGRHVILKGRADLVEEWPFFFGGNLKEVKPPDRGFRFQYPVKCVFC